MGKGNAFLGQLRGKVGDVVFSVVDGKQISRPYVDRPSNPRTDKQLMQRAIFANFSRLIYEGRKIYGHCVENVSDEQKTLHKLATYSLKNYRNWCIATLNDTDVDQTYVTGGYPVGVPKSVADFVAVPAAIVVARGSLRQDVFNIPYVGNPDIFFSLAIIGQAAGVSVREIANRLKLKQGDTFTFVAQTVDDSIIIWHDVETDLRIYRSYFDYLTIRVREDAFRNETIPAEMKWSDIFHFVDASKATADVLDRLGLLDVLLPYLWCRGNKQDGYARWLGFATCIRSRGKLRSTAIMGGAWNFNVNFKSSGIPVNQVPRFWRE